MVMKTTKTHTKHCEDCASFIFKDGKRRGICISRPTECTSAIYASRRTCNRFEEREDRNAKLEGLMKHMKCECCGGIINTTTMKCEYCETPYFIKNKPIAKDIHHKFESAMHDVEEGIISPNEFRIIMGLKEIK